MVPNCVLEEVNDRVAPSAVPSGDEVFWISPAHARDGSCRHGSPDTKLRHTQVSVVEISQDANPCSSVLLESNCTLESTIEEYNRRLYTQNYHEMNQTNWDIVESIAREQHLEARVRELEKEKANAMQEHQSALINAADCIAAAERKIEELEKTHCKPEPQERALTASPQ
ncbi:MAG: hypothetical protein M1813_000159 [Trichoglossum hirsutum]|nr:MAG: hypothetical protein M1813_000159 [Trichoglossum hirsutum]